MTEQETSNTRGAMCAFCDYPRPAGGCRLCDDGDPEQGPGFVLGDLAKGFLIYFQASFRLLNHKTYLGRIFWPVAWNLVVMVTVGAISLFVVHRGMTGLVEWMSGVGGSTYQAMPGWIQAVLDFVSPLFVWFWSGATAFLLTFCVVIYGFPMVMALFLFPVLDPVAYLAETEALGFTPPKSARGYWGDFWDSLDTGARILSIQLLVLLVSLPASMLVIAVPIVLGAAAFLAGFTWVDYPFSRRGYGYRQKWRLAKRHWALLTGFGFAFELGLVIPLFNVFLAAPTAAAGAAFLYFEFAKDELGGSHLQTSSLGSVPSDSGSGHATGT